MAGGVIVSSEEFGPGIPSNVLPGNVWIPAIFHSYNRSIGGIVAQVIIEEQHTDEIRITEHPVEQGAPISDHAYKIPANIQITAGWSTTFASDLSAESGVYGLLLSMQAMLIPFDVITGKRWYKNMLIQKLIVTTDEKSEFALMAQITCQQVIIVGTQTVSTNSSSDNPDNHQDAPSTAPSEQQGDQPTTTPNQSSQDKVSAISSNNDAGTGGLANKGIDTSTTTSVA